MLALFPQHPDAGLQLLIFASNLGLSRSRIPVRPDRFCNFRKVTLTGCRHNTALIRSRGYHRLPVRAARRQTQRFEHHKQLVIKRCHALIVKVGRHRAIDGHLIERLVKRLPVTLCLFTYIPQSVFGTLTIELVDRNKIGIVQHVDLLKLSCSTKFWCHHVERAVNQRYDPGITLADPGCFNYHQSEACALGCFNNLRQLRWKFQPRSTRCQRTHENRSTFDGIHPDPIPQKGPTSFSARWIYRQYCNSE